MNILITGGNGYIGGIITKRLMEKGHNTFVLDHHYSPLPGNFNGDLADTQFLDNVFKSKKIDAVMHLASYIEVAESMKDPFKYYKNNYCNTVNLLDSMLKNNVKNIIYASSAAVYGQPKKIPITEDSEKMPVNHYGKTKLMVEELLQNCPGLNSVALRFFNASGAAYSLGENHNPETHFIPLLLDAVLNKGPIKINGNDFNTKDGTCIRDYVHVLDIADAHILALEKLREGYNAYNIGSGRGYSLLEVIGAAKEVCKRDIAVEFGPRRDGDPAELVASIDKIKSELGWQPKHDIKSILQSALDYMISKS